MVPGRSGITACQVLKARGIPYDCFEKGSMVGGNWRYENDNGVSSAYRSLHINSAARVDGLPAPSRCPRTTRTIPSHFQVARYFDDYVERFGLARGSPSTPRWSRPSRSRASGTSRVEDGDGRARDRALPRRPRRQRPPLEPALARTGLSGLGGVRRRADPRPPLPRARRAGRQAGAGAGDRQLGRRRRGRVLADRREDLPGDAPRRLRTAQVSSAASRSTKPRRP